MKGGEARTRDVADWEVTMQAEVGIGAAVAEDMPEWRHWTRGC